MLPFTVEASAQPWVVTLTLPLTVLASASATRPRAVTLPFTFLPTNRTPLGTRTSKSASALVSSVFIRPSSPGAHSLGLFERPGNMAQMVTPPLCSTTSKVSSSRSRPSFSAVTWTSAPSVWTARMFPLMPLISMLLPAAIRPLQLKSWAETVPPARNVRAIRMAKVLERFMIDVSRCGVVVSPGRRRGVVRWCHRTLRE